MQAKVAHPVSERFSVGAAIAAGWQARTSPRYGSSSAIAIATWAAREDVVLHVNIGRDFVHQGPDGTRGGIAVEWAPRQDWSLLAERYREEDTHYLRAGVRWTPAPRWQLDFSGARRLSGPDPSVWTVGVTYAWD